MPVELIEVSMPIGPVEAVELGVAYIDRDADIIIPGEGGTVNISPDPLNMIEVRPNGLFVTTMLSSAQW